MSSPCLVSFLVPLPEAGIGPLNGSHLYRDQLYLLFTDLVFQVWHSRMDLGTHRSTPCVYGEVALSHIVQNNIEAACFNGGLSPTESKDRWTM